DEQHRDRPCAVRGRDRVQSGERDGHDRAIKGLEPRFVQGLPKAHRAAPQRDADGCEHAEGLTETETGLHASSIPAWTTSTTSTTSSFRSWRPANAGSTSISTPR